MKMHFVFGPFFWGMVILLIGLGIILRAFNINLPLLRIFFGLIIILIGIRLIVGVSGSKMNSTSVFEERNWSSSSRNRDFNIIFSSGLIDLTKGEVQQQYGKREINVIFGSGTVLLSDKIPTEIDVNTVFGQVHLPTRDISMFGEDTYRMNTENDSLGTMRIEANAIFSEIYFKVVKRNEAAPGEATE